uniref:Uncharacterized protein n=1 Tax=Anopheles quadriannulatus TaxID=34691 RepID=A0A182XRS3_ANOQN
MQRTATNTGHRSNVCYNTTRSLSLAGCISSLGAALLPSPQRKTISQSGWFGPLLPLVAWLPLCPASVPHSPTHTLVAGKYRANMKRANNLNIPNCYQTSIFIFDAFRLLNVAVILTTISASHFAFAPQP